MDHTINFPLSNTIQHMASPFDLQTLVDDFDRRYPFMLVSGIRGSGKTTFIKEFMELIDLTDHSVFLFKNSLDDTQIPANQTFALKSEEDFSALKTIITFMREYKRMKIEDPDIEPYTAVIIFDDILSSLAKPALKRQFDTLMSELAYEGRHLRIKVILSTQVLTKLVDINFRGNCDWFLFRGVPKQRRELVKKVYAPEMKQHEFTELMRELAVTYDILVVDRQEELSILRRDTKRGDIIPVKATLDY